MGAQHRGAPTGPRLTKCRQKSVSTHPIKPPHFRGTSAQTSALLRRALAADVLDEKLPQASALGYVADTTKADGKQFPKHTADQDCHNCALSQGKATKAAGSCPLFAGKQVAGKGWCSAWNKKA